MGVSGVRGSLGGGLELELRLYGRMLLIRRFEELVQTLFLRGEVCRRARGARGPRRGARRKGGMTAGGAATWTLVEVRMPRLSDSMEEATIVRWLKRPGEAVANGHPLVEVETDKATVAYEAELDGVLAEVVVDEGGTAALGGVIARLAVEGAAAPEPAPRAGRETLPAAWRRSWASSST